jgi:hypothetical protein
MKKVAPLPTSESGATFLIPKTAEAIQGIIWRQRMYTQVVADLYPGQVAGGQPEPPVGTRFVFTNLTFLAESGAIWFLVWWLFLHRRLRLRQRGSKSED